jgi:hemoglobin/transferrin/lactoferrin receptor protein
MKLYLNILSFFAVASYAQTAKDTLKTKKLDEVIVTTSKLLKSKAFQSQKIESISQKEIEFQNFQTTADVLANSGTATVQKSQQGGGSPVLRGFEASRILLLVDGVRMNNLIFRAGHLQNSITVDKNILENIDVLYGSGSTLFGSDALGGAINMTTKKAKFLSDAKKPFTGNLITRYSSVNQEKAGHFDLNYAKENFASLTSFSYTDFGDLLMGKKQNHNNPFFGERYNYVETVNSVDVVVPNDDKYLQKPSAYKQYDFMQKLAYKQANGNQHSLNFQYSTTTTIDRFDRLTDVETKGARIGKLSRTKWYYGPQKRLLAIYSFSKEKAFLNSDLSLNLSYQNVEESRLQRNFGNYALQNRIEKVAMYSVDLLLKKKFTKGELNYGLESYLDDLKSEGFSNNSNTGEIKTINSRYPNGKNNMFRNDLFATYNETINDKINWNIGGRIGFTTLKSSIEDNTIFKLPFTSINQSNLMYSANLGIVHKPNKNMSLIANLSSGFRVPNIDDLSKVFESTKGAIIVPNENLKPEKTIGADFGIRFGSKNKRFELETNYFYTKFIDAIVTDSFTYNGSDKVIYDGVLSNVTANQNKGKAYITGISSELKTYLVGNLLFNATINYTVGRITEDKNRPLDHIAPLFGKLGFNYAKSIYSLDAYMLYNGKKDIRDYLLKAEDNEDYAPKDGMPAWQTYNFKASVSVFKSATLFAGVENILDTQYRTFSSGMNAPGRNIYGGLRYSF